MKIKFIIIQTDQSAKVYFEDNTFVIVPKSKVDFNIEEDAPWSNN